MLGELAEIEFLLEGLAEETAVAVDNDKIERMLTIAGAFDHLLEDGRRSSPADAPSFDELGNNS